MDLSPELFVELDDEQAQLVKGGFTLSADVSSFIGGVSALLSLDAACWEASAVEFGTQLGFSESDSAFVALLTFFPALINCRL